MVVVTVVVPVPVLVASPDGVIAATSALDDAHVTQGVTSLVVPSLNSASALNCVKPPRSRSRAAGDTTSEAAAALVTVKSAVPACPPNTATMVAVPGSSPLACPALMVAIDGIEDVHKANVVRS